MVSTKEKHNKTGKKGILSSDYKQDGYRTFLIKGSKSLAKHITLYVSFHFLDGIEHIQK